MTESQELLSEYVRSGSESAFRRIVELYSALVYSTALRLVDGDAHRAKDVAQTVFIDLTRMAGKLSQNSMLGGWLHRHTCFVASTVMRGERRRQAREQTALSMNTLTSEEESHFIAVAPVLDEAIHALGPDDRDVILLRYFEHQSLRAVGETLGISENVAQKRVARALGELRLILGQPGTGLSVATLGAILSAKAVTAAPVGLVAQLAGAALAATGATPATSLLHLLMSGKVKAALIAALFITGLTSTLLLLNRHEAVPKSSEPNVANVQEDTPPIPAPAVRPTVPAPPKQSPIRQPNLGQPTTPTIESPTTTLETVPPNAQLPDPVQSSASPPPPRPPYLRFRPMPGSQIRIDGDSTAHKWHMLGSMIGGSFSLPADIQLDSAHNVLTGIENGFIPAEASAIIAVRSVHSVEKVMPNVMDGLYQDALKEKTFPKITYTLHQMRIKAATSGQGFEFATLGDLAIAGVTNRLSMPVKLLTTNDGILKITGSVSFKMSDFKIDPPAPSFGLGVMKCADEVTVTFEWLLKAETQAPSTAQAPAPIPPDLQNLAFGIIPTSSDPNVSSDKLAKITDGKISPQSEDVVLLRKGTQWVQIDLGRDCQIYTIALWHNYETLVGNTSSSAIHNLVFHRVIIQTADDPNFSNGVQTLFNNDSSNVLGLGAGTDLEYPETVDGKRIQVNGLTARYLRFYSRGSTDSSMNEYTEIEVYGK